MSTLSTTKTLYCKQFKQFDADCKIIRKDQEQMNQQEVTLKVRKSIVTVGSLLLVALVFGANVGLRSFQPGMTDTVDPKVTVSDTDSSDREKDLYAVDPPDPDLDLRDVDPPDPDLDLRDVDPPDPDIDEREVDLPDPDLAR